MADAFAVAKAVVSVVTTVKDYYDYLTNPDVKELARLLDNVRSQVWAVHLHVAALKQQIYRDSIVEIEAKVASAEEDFALYLKSNDNHYLTSAKASALEAYKETQGKPYTWYSEIDTYLRAVAIRIKWFQFVEAIDPTQADIRKAEMRSHVDHIGKLVLYLNTRSAGLVELKEEIEWDTDIKPPAKYHAFWVHEMSESGGYVPGTSKEFPVRNKNVGQARRQAEAYAADLLLALRNRIGLPAVEQVQAHCATLT